MAMKFDPTAICGNCDAVFPNSESDAHRCTSAASCDLQLLVIDLGEWCVIRIEQGESRVFKEGQLFALNIVMTKPHAHSLLLHLMTGNVFLVNAPLTEIQRATAALEGESKHKVWTHVARVGKADATGVEQITDCDIWRYTR